MQDEISRTLEEEDRSFKRGIMALLMSPEAQRPISVAELERHTGSGIETVDAVDALYSEGLIHRMGEFVFATRAAMCMDGMPY